MEMAEQYRMGKNKEIFFVKQQFQKNNFFEHIFLFFFLSNLANVIGQTMFITRPPANTLNSEYRMST